MQTENNPDLPIPPGKARYHPDTGRLLVPQGYTLVDYNLMEAHVARTRPKSNSVCAACPYYGFIYSRQSNTCQITSPLNGHLWTTCPGYDNKLKRSTHVIVPESMLPELLVTRMMQASGEKP